MKLLAHIIFLKISKNVFRWVCFTNGVIKKKKSWYIQRNFFVYFHKFSFILVCYFLDSLPEIRVSSHALVPPTKKPMGCCLECFAM